MAATVVLGSGQYTSVYAEGDFAVKIQPVHFEGVGSTALVENNFLLDCHDPNIVRCHGVSFGFRMIAGKQTLCLLTKMERCDKRLNEIYSEGACGADVSIKYIYQMFSALGYLHRHHVIHGDVKPDNLMIKYASSSSEGTLKLIDFNLSQHIFNAQLRTHLIQSIRYRAPEVILGSRYYDERVDCWSVGVILMEIVFGHVISMEINNSFKLLMDYVDVFGLPDSKAWRDLVTSTIKSDPSRTSLYTKLLTPTESPTREYAFTVWLKTNLTEKYEHALEKFGEKNLESLISLIQQCLTLDPSQRIHCSTALKHPMFDKVRCSSGAETKHYPYGSGSSSSSTTTEKKLTDSRDEALMWLNKLFTRCEKEYGWMENTITIARCIAEDVSHSVKGFDDLNLNVVGYAILILALKYNEGFENIDSEHLDNIASGISKDDLLQASWHEMSILNRIGHRIVNDRCRDLLTPLIGYL